MSNYHLERHSEDDQIALIRWCVADLIQVLEDKGIPVTDDTIDMFLNSRGTKTLEERSIEEGWQILSDVVDIVNFDEEEEEE